MSFTRRDLLAAAAASLAGGCAAARQLQANLITPSYGAFPREGAERGAALALLDELLDESMRRGVSRTRAAQREIEAFAETVNRRSVEPHEALHNPFAGDTLVVDATDHKKLVVFSDHHLGSSTQRQNVFSGPGGRHYRFTNHLLYEAVLERYLASPTPYTLVENGDVEDLVVFDPKDHPGEYALRRWLCADRSRDAATEAEARELRQQALTDRRDAFRRLLLAETLADPKNQAYYALIERFDRAGRLFRLAGNHDHMRKRHWDDAVAAATAARPGAAFPTAERMGMMLVLARGSAWETVILHGHQFDHSSSPLNASVHGETISECLGIWYQGADRIWPWSEWCEQWTSGRPFSNRLVAGTPQTLREQFDTARPEAQYSHVHREEARQRLWAFPVGPGIFESVFEHPVAWEYLARPGDEQDSALIGVFRAVGSGEAWFKYRHTKELEMASSLRRLVDGRPPTVILGHTHEPRAGALDAFGEPVEWYLNAAAAGRFEGLIWAVEVDDGEPRVVSWHADPFPDGKPVRRVWQPAGAYRELLSSRVEELS